MITIGFDATHDNIAHLPQHMQAAGYTTGTAGIRWTSADWAAHPGAVRIDQDFAASDPSADVLDVENGAATFADCAPWAKKALADYAAAVRPGQRRPAIYFSASNVHNVANALVGGGVTGGVGFWIASWGIGEQQAIADVSAGSGPFPIVAVQYNDGPFFDYDIFSAQWLEEVSGVFARNPVPGLKIVRRGWTSVTLGWDGDKHASSYTVRTYLRGTQVQKEVVTTPGIRVGHLMPGHNYTFKVRAHPGNTAPSAEIKTKTRIL